MGYDSRTNHESKVTRELSIRPAAEAELIEAYAWYEERVPNLGTEFLLAADACFNSISRNPEMCPVVHRTIRKALLRRFPYAVLYVLEENQIVILALFHAKRNPRHWQDRA